MTPNIVDVPEEPGVINNKSIRHLANGVSSENNSALKTFLSTMILLANLFIGATVIVSLMFSFQGGLPLGATMMHIVLCVIGYQLLMSQAILSLSPTNSWSSHLKLVGKRRAHWILQIAGSVLAIGGSFVKIIDKSVHWNSYHGQFALVALVFTLVSLINGLSSLWAYELRRYVPSNLSKLTHICFGTVAFVTASISLCYGFDKAFFRSWATEPITDTLIAFTAIFTFIIIVNPLVVFMKKLKNVAK